MQKLRRISAKSRRPIGWPLEPFRLDGGTFADDSGWLEEIVGGTDVPPAHAPAKMNPPDSVAAVHVLVVPAESCSAMM
jgi:hypothetical protein